MGAPKGNQFWKLRSEHGRDYLFETPELLEAEIAKYFNWVDSHPWYKVEAVKSGDFAGTLIKVPNARPYTLSGLCIFLNASESYWKEFRKNANLSKDFLSVISRTEEIIRTNKFEGAAVGAFNANIMARDLGLRENTALTGPDGGPIQTESKVTQHTVVFKRFKSNGGPEENTEHGDQPDVQ